MEVMSAFTDFVDLLPRCQGGCRFQLFPTLFSTNLSLGFFEALVPPHVLLLLPRSCEGSRQLFEGFLEEFPAGVEILAGTALPSSSAVSHIMNALCDGAGEVGCHICVVTRREITIHGALAFPGNLRMADFMVGIFSCQTFGDVFGTGG